MADTTEVSARSLTSVLYPIVGSSPFTLCPYLHTFAIGLG
jgi:hypothetical protein